MSSRPRVLAPARFLLCLLLLLALFCSPLLLSYRFLRQYGETLSPAQVVERLEHDPQLFYRSAMHDDLRETALEMLRRRQPEIIALGSSLPLYFREEFFTTSFVCAAGVMDSLNDGEIFVRRMHEVARPRLVLFTVDFWWLTDAEVRFRGLINPPDQSPRLSFTKLRFPYKLLGKRQITLQQLFGLELIPPVEVVGNPPLGLMARLDGVGRRRDGSELNGLLFTGRAKDFYEPIRRHFSNADEFVMQPGRFGPDLKILPERVEILRRIIHRLEEHGAKVILIYPPMAPPIAAAMERSGHHAHFLELGRQLLNLGPEAYDFHSPSALGIPVSEFADTHHAGNNAYMRLLARILEQRPGSSLSQHVNTVQIAKWIEKYEGTTVTVFKNDRITVAEQDFLNLGRPKDRAPHVVAAQPTAP